MEKILIKSAEEYKDAAERIKTDLCTGTMIDPPESYPCILVFQTYDVQNQRMDGLYYEYVYQGDFDNG